MPGKRARLPQPPERQCQVMSNFARTKVKPISEENHCRRPGKNALRSAPRPPLAPHAQEVPKVSGRPFKKGAPLRIDFVEYRIFFLTPVIREEGGSANFGRTWSRPESAGRNAVHSAKSTAGSGQNMERSKFSPEHSGLSTEVSRKSPALATVNPVLSIKQSGRTTMRNSAPCK